MDARSALLLPPSHAKVRTRDKNKHPRTGLGYLTGIMALPISIGECSYANAATRLLHPRLHLHLLVESSRSDANEMAGDDTLSVCSSFATQWPLGHFYLPTNSPLDIKRDATAFMGNLILIGSSFHH